MVPLHLKLKAIDHEHNIHRDYEIVITQSLFGLWGVITAYGRCAQKGKQNLYHFETEAETKIFIHKTLQKRLTARKRIGCPYTLGNNMLDSSTLPLLRYWIHPQQLELLKNNHHVSDFSTVSTRNV